MRAAPRGVPPRRGLAERRWVRARAAGLHRLRERFAVLPWHRLGARRRRLRSGAVRRSCGRARRGSCRVRLLVW